MNNSNLKTKFLRCILGQLKSDPSKVYGQINKIQEVSLVEYVNNKSKSKSNNLPQIKSVEYNDNLEKYDGFFIYLTNENLIECLTSLENSTIVKNLIIGSYCEENEIEKVKKLFEKIKKELTDRKIMCGDCFVNQYENHDKISKNKEMIIVFKTLGKRKDLYIDEDQLAPQRKAI
ncbi:MAG: hypothetical protein RR847_03130 [Bacilli bacterium]